MLVVMLPPGPVSPGPVHLVGEDEPVQPVKVLDGQAPREGGDAGAPEPGGGERRGEHPARGEGLEDVGGGGTVPAFSHSAA